jgi:hypothetical protein
MMSDVLVVEGAAACDYCGRAARKKRLPPGWKRHQDKVACAACWAERYLLRAISLPVASPVNLTWAELRTRLKPLWRETTRASNWMMTELYKRDIRRAPMDTKMPPMQPCYLYPEARVLFPELPAQTVSSIEHVVARKYRAKRYEIIWTAASSLPNHRYPTPFPVHNQSWHAMLVEDRPVVSLRLGDRAELRLKSGPQFARQLAAFRQVASGAAVKGELAVYQIRDFSEPEARTILMVKLVAWLPRPAGAGRTSTGVLRVHTGKDELLTALNVKDEKLWVYNGDHLRRWTVEHRRLLERWAEDAKYENRPVPSFAERRTASVAKFGRRMHSAVHEIAAQLAGYAARRHFAVVEYDDHERGFCSQFPWARLKQLIAEKLDALGIEFKASGAAEAEIAEPLAEE